MAVLLVAILVGLVLLWTKQQRLVGRIEQLEQALGGGEVQQPASIPQTRPAGPLAHPVIAPPPPAELVGAGPARSPDEPLSKRPPVGEALSGWFERYVGGRLLIWIGGIALAVAGILIVRFSIGLITPAVRMGLAAALGLALVAGGEIAHRRRGAALDPRVAQALVGAGILILYAAPYGALVLYQLIGNGTASALMIAVTAAALLLSFRHGAPTAVMGLAGGFAIPYLVGERSATALPLLAYLALLDVALFAVAVRRRWTWLGAAAALLSFAWMVPILFWSPADALDAGLFILALSLAASFVRAGEGWQLDFMRPAAIGLLQLAILVARTDLGPAAWILFGALSLASFPLAIRRAEYRLIPAFALAAALLLLAVKAVIDWRPLLAGIGLAITLLFAGGAFLARRRDPGRIPWTVIACAAAAAPPVIIRLARPTLAPLLLWALVFAAAALVPLLFAVLARRGRDGSRGGVGLAVATAAFLLGVSIWELLPPALVASGWLVIAILVALGSRRAEDRGVVFVAFAAAAIAVLRCVSMVPDLWTTLAAAAGGSPALAADLPPVGDALQTLLLPAGLLGVLWFVDDAEAKRRRDALLAAAGLLGGTALYILFKQAYGLTDEADFAARGFAERTIITQALFALGWLICTGRLPIPSLDEEQRWLAGVALTATAAGRLLLFDLLVDNPLMVAQSVGRMPVLNLLVPAYLLSAFWLYRARRGAAHRGRSGLWLTLSLVSLVFGVMTLVRQGFEGPILSAPHLPATESYGYSLAGLLLSITLLLGGMRLPDKALRVAGLLLLTATTLKVFLVDASALEGVLRILSFLGLGIALIGIGKLYTAVLNAEAGFAMGQEGG
jgi:uncharacterized membrane protein